MPPGSIESFDLSRFFVVVHWLGMLLGLGAAAFADAFGARVLLSSRPGPRPAVLKGLHATIGVAMLLLIFSGTGLIVLRADRWCELPDNVIRFAGVCLPYKLATKLVLMATLLAVATMIESLLLPLAHRGHRPLIATLSAFEIARATAIVSASFTCWVMLAAIPQIAALQALSPAEFLPRLVVIWFAITLSGSIGMLALRAMICARRVDGHRLPKYSADGGATHSPSTAWLPRVVSGSGAITGALPVVSVPQQRPVRVTGERPLVAVSRLLRPALWGTFAISFVINALMLTGPLYMLQVYDRVLTSRSSETLVVLSVLVVGLLAVLGVLEVIRSRILSRTAVRLDSVLAEPLLAASVRVGARQSRASQQSPVRDLEQIRQFVAGPAVPAMLDLPWAPLYFALVFLLHPALGMLAVAGAVVLLTLSLLNQVLTRKPLAAAMEATGKCDGLVEAGWRGAETLRALGMSGSFGQRWSAAHTNAMIAHLRAGDCAVKISTAIRVARMLVQSLLLGAGAWLALHDAVSAGAMIAVSIVAGRALVPIEQIVAQWRGVMQAFEAAQRCRSCLSADPEAAGGLDLPPPRGRVTVSGLYVTPLGGSQPVVKGLAFQLEPGDALAVVGPSATGKSTLAKALVGVWPVRAGEIRLDGATLSQWNPDALGRHIGYLPQDAFLFDGTISDNIARLDSRPDPNAVIAAARAAGVHEMILRLEHGYATRVGEGGTSLSGGQRQRIALARALYGDPALIVMDEPNANLDAAGENALIEAIGRLRAARRTVIVMAHRRSVIAAVNRVLVLNDGRQTAFGPPDKVFKPEPSIAKEATNDNRIAAARLATGLVR